MSDIIIGRNAVIETFKSGLDIEKIYLQNNMRGEFEVEIRNLCRDHGVPLAKVPDAKLNELSRNKVHQGVIAYVSAITYVDYHDVIKESMEKGRTPLLVILDNITDVRNIGAIARSAHYFGSDGLIIAGSFSGRINEDTIKASAGAILQLPISRANSLFTVVSDLQSLGIKVVATSLKDAVIPNESDLNEPLAIIMGSEDKGVHYKVLEIVDEVIKIPAVADFDSLNVSVATGIILYECNRQRSAATT
jgi:23S rRNA (guanosine2251-2'-O)-methyltransferase